MIDSYGKVLNKKITISSAILTFAGLLSGMANITYGISVFGFIMLYAYFDNEFAYWTFIFPAIGYFLQGNISIAVSYGAALIMLTAVKALKPKSRKVFKISAAFIVFITESIRMFFQGFLYYGMLIILLEIIIFFVCSEYYSLFVNFFLSDKLKRSVTKKELVSIILVLYISLSSVSKIEFSYGIKPIGIISVYAVLCSAILFDSPITASIGTLLGFLCGISDTDILYTTGSYALSGFFSSLSKKYGKCGIASAFILTNAIITFYVNGSEKALINIYEILFGTALFCVTPVKYLKNLRSGILLLNPLRGDEEMKKFDCVKETALCNINKFSGALKAMSASLKPPKQQTFEVSTPELVNEIKLRVCDQCTQRGYCLGSEKENTYQVFEKLIKTVRKKGILEYHDLPSRFKEHCVSPGRIVIETNKVYELFKVNYIWENKIRESRNIIKSQLEDISDGLKGFAEEFSDFGGFEPDKEKDTVTLLTKLGVPVTYIAISRDINFKYKVKAGVRNSVKRKTNEFMLEAALGKTLGVNMKASDSYLKDDNCFFEFEEEERFEILTAVSRIRAENKKESGDSYAVIKPGGGKSIVALSDGMGTGEKAKNKSMETVTLLDALINSGIKREKAVKLINSVLILKSYDESFATLDILITDLFTGDGEFIKTGAVPSFLKSGGKVTELRGESLPAGIIPDIKMSSVVFKFKGGDILVMMSDGVYDCFENVSEISEIILNNQEKGLKEYADYIMEEAYKRLKRVNDDMTVITVKFTEK